jgi:hypothetical protein
MNSVLCDVEIPVDDFGWVQDPDTAEIPQRVATALVGSPDLAKTVLELLNGILVLRRRVKIS